MTEPSESEALALIVNEAGAVNVESGNGDVIEIVGASVTVTKTGKDVLTAPKSSYALTVNSYFPDGVFIQV